MATSDWEAPGVGNSEAMHLSQVACIIVTVAWEINWWDKKAQDDQREMRFKKQKKESKDNEISLTELWETS